MNTTYPPFTPEQRIRWRQHWDTHLEHGKQAAIAGDLKRLKVKGENSTRGPDTWKVYLSRFFGGDDRVIATVLGIDEAAHIIARSVGLRDAQELRDLHARFAGFIGVGPLDVLIPGFEDLGAVPADEIYVPVNGGGGTGCIAGDDDSKIDIFPLTLENLHHAATPGKKSRAILVEAGRALGKTTMLKAIRAQLHASGVAFGDTLEQAGSVLIVDDWDRLPAERRAGTRQWLEGPARVAILSMSMTFSESPFCTSQATIRLAPMGSYNLLDYLVRLRDVASRRWKLQIDPERFRGWLEDDPLAPRLAMNFSTIGIVAREVAGGVSLPLRTRDWPRYLSNHMLRLSSRDENVAQHEFWKVCGEEFLAEMTELMLRSGAGSLPRREVLEVIVRIAGHFGARVHFDDAGAFHPLGSALRHGLMREDGDRISLSTPALAWPAARGGWRELLKFMLCRPDAQDAVVAAAENDGDSVLRAALELDPAVLCDSMVGLTRLVAADAPYRDATTWLRAFRMCAVWWAHAPLSPSASPEAGQPAKPASERIQESSPLLILAQAGMRHKALMGTRMEALSPEVDLPGALRTWLRIFGVSEPDSQTLEAVQRFVAPAQVDGFPREGDIHHGRDWNTAKIPGLVPPDWYRWWRTCVAPVFRNHPSGERLLAGTEDGASVIPMCYQDTDSGLKLWLDALTSRVTHGDPNAAKALADAFTFALENGGWRLQDALAQRSRTWFRLRSPLRPLLMERLVSLEPRSWWQRESPPAKSLLQFILSDIFIETDRLVLWEAWASHEDDGLPWKPFVEAGLPLTLVVDWALARGEEGLAEHVDRLSSVFDGKERSYPSRRLLALRAIAEGEDVAAGVRMLAGPIPWSISSVVERRLAGVDPHIARRERIQAALASGSPARYSLLRNVIPTPDDEALWKEVIDSSFGLDEHLGRLAQWCGGQVGEVRWLPLLSAIDDVESILRTKGRRRAKIRERIAREIESLRHHGANLLESYVARNDLPGPEDRHEVVRRLLKGEFWPPLFVEGWSRSGIWPLAARILPQDELLGMVSADAKTVWGTDARVARLHSLMMGGQFNLVVELLHDSELGSSAAQVLSGLRYGDPVWPLKKVKEILGVDAPRFDGVVDTLLVVSARHDAMATFEWLEPQLKRLDPCDARSWLERLVPAMPLGSGREAAIRALFRVG